ncbi:MAG: hypothetical protein N3E39_00365 [Candidatus Methanomethylicia archaeon]|nr:hypothetical protein [Candidatus Methanomethylicia archaeon]
MRKIQYKLIPIITSILLVLLCFWLIPFISNFILLVLLVEIASITTFYLAFIIFIPWFQSRKIDLESIFICGLAKPPYISLDEVYLFNIPFMEVKVDEH